MTEAEARKLWRICPSARVGNFICGGDQIVKAVSVANRDRERPEVMRILKNQRTLWPPNACNSFMTMWVARRTWYPVWD